MPGSFAGLWRRGAASLPPVEGMAYPALVIDCDGRILLANDAALGLARAIATEAFGDLRRAIAVAARDGRSLACTAQIASGGTAPSVELTVVPLGQGRALVLTRQGRYDRNLREALVDSRRRYKDLVEIAGDFAWETGPDGAFVYVSPAGALGWSAEQLLGRTPEMFLVGDAASMPLDGEDGFGPFRARRALQNAETWFRRADGSVACLAASVRPLYDADGRWAGARGLCRDISDARKRDEMLARAHARERLFGHIVRTMREEAEPGRMLAAAAGAVARALTAGGLGIYRMTGGGPQAVIAHGDGAPAAAAGAIAASLRRPGAVCAESADAALIAVATRYRDAVNGVLVAWRDPLLGAFSEDERALAVEAAGHLALALEQVAAHDRLEELSSTDALTGLLNRRSFMDGLARRFERTATGNGGGALVYCDLDNFKQVNDTHGHERGDAALRELAAILTGSTRGEDLVARLGGDEFALWLEGTDETAARARALHLLDRARALLPYSGAPDRPLGLSLGIAVTRPGSGETLAALMARADGAMYDAKREGKGRCSVALPPDPDSRLRAGGRS